MHIISVATFLTVTTSSVTLALLTSCFVSFLSISSGVSRYIPQNKHQQILSDFSKTSWLVFQMLPQHFSG